MKQAIFSFLFFVTSVCGFTQNQGADQSISAPVNKVVEPASAVIPSVAEMFSDILKVTGLPSDFKVKQARVMNIEASHSFGKKYIRYNPEFINWINVITRDKWGAITLLAHEMGHLMKGHTSKRSGSKPDLELEADEFAGLVAYKMGASLEDAQKVMFYIANEGSSTTHPGRFLRLAAIQQGWEKARRAGMESELAHLNSAKLHRISRFSSSGKTLYRQEYPVAN